MGVTFDSQAKRFRPGDVLFGKLRPYLAKVARPTRDGVCVGEFFVLRSRSSGLFSPYLEYLLRSRPIIDAINSSTFGAKMPRADWQFVGNLRLSFPPLPEQFAIVRFLDHADRRIRRYILAKQKLIKLLEEQKQAIIHRAVTRGLDPNVRLKPSGVAWLGYVPKHWEVVRVKEVTTPIEQGWSPQCDAQPAADHEWGVLKVGCVNRDAFDECQNKKLPATLEPIPDLQIRDGDILVSRANTRELLGLAALAANPREKLMLCDKLFRFRAKPERADPHFLVYAMRQRTSRVQIESSANGASDSMQNIGQGVVRNLLLSLPPVDEQREVVAAVEAQTCVLGIAVAQAYREIFLLREYRTRLIADMVSGKLDVREAAARLPDEPQADDASEAHVEKLDASDTEDTIDDEVEV